MSISPYFFVEKKNRENGKWELIAPYVWNYNHSKLIPADLWPFNGTHDLFNILTNNQLGNIPEFRGVHAGIPKDACSEVREAYGVFDTNDTEFSFAPQAYWFSYLAMMVYVLKHPKVIDYNREWDDEEDVPQIDNPLLELKERVDMFLEIVDPFLWEEEYDYIRIVFWLSR